MEGNVNKNVQNIKQHYSIHPNVCCKDREITTKQNNDLFTFIELKLNFIGEFN